MRILLFADIHIGSIKDITYVYNVMTNIIDEELIYKKTDLVVILGDYFHRLFKVNEEYVSLAINIMSYLIRACKKSKAKLRIVYGTESHEMNQYRLFNYHITSSNIDLKIFDTCTEETINGCNILYVPEEYIDDKHEFYKNTLYSNKKYYYIFGHGVIEDGMPRMVTVSNENNKNNEKHVPIFKSGELGSKCKLCIFGHVHCLPLDITDVLTIDGYKKINELTYDDEIACWNKETNLIEFHKPKNIIIRDLYPNEMLYKFYSYSYNENNKERSPRFEFLSTSEHRNLLAGEDVISRCMPKLFKLDDFLQEANGLDPKFVKTRYSNDEIRLLAWIIGDGTFEVDSSHGIRIRFHLKKERKIKRLKYLLTKLNIDFSVHIQSSGNTKINIIGKTQEYVKSLFDIIDNKPIKTYPKDLLFISNDQFKILLKELIMVDGDYETFIKTGECSYRLNTSKKEEINFLSMLFIINGYQHKVVTRRPNYYHDTYNDHNYLTLLNVLGRDKWLKKDLCEYNGKVGCVSVPTTYFIAKQNGVPFITGNCYTEMGNVYYLGSLFRDSFGEEEPKGYGIIEDDKFTFIENKEAYVFKTYEFDPTSDIYLSSQDIINEVKRIKEENKDLFEGEKSGKIRLVFKTPNNLDGTFKDNLKDILLEEKFIVPLIKENNHELSEELKDEIEDEYDFIIDSSLPITDKIFRYINKEYNNSILTMEELKRYLEPFINKKEKIEGD